jgi:hypothetical protein
MKIIYDLLPNDLYDKLRIELMSDSFPWYWNDFINKDDENLGGFQLVHGFYRDGKSNSNMLPLVSVVMDAFKEQTNQKIKSVNRIKANLNPRNSFIVEHSDAVFHQDEADSKYTTLLYYVNDCDGNTLFEDQEVTPKGNSLVVFKSNTKHAGLYPSIEKRKIVINFIVELE